MDQERQRIQDDLRGLITGEVRCDDIFVQMYASDASIYELSPMGVVRPRSAADVIATVNYARENGYPIHARGAGTGLAGGASARRLLSICRAICSASSILTVTSCVCSPVRALRLNGDLRPYQRHYGVDPFSANVTTIGGMLAIDAKGSRGRATGPHATTYAGYESYWPVETRSSCIATIR